MHTGSEVEFDASVCSSSLNPGFITPETKNSYFHLDKLKILGHFWGIFAWIKTGDQRYTQLQKKVYTLSFGG